MKLAMGLLLFCPLAYGAACPSGQAKNPTVLVQLEQTWAKAIERHDTAALSCILADEFEDADPEGRLSGRAEVLSKAASGPGLPHQLSELHAEVHGDFGYIRGLATAVNPQTKLVARVRFTDIYVYRDGRWQCVAGHESVLPASH